MKNKNSTKLLSGVEQLDRSVLLTETGAPQFTRAFIAATFLIVFIFITWASFIKVDEVAKASGEIKSSLPVHPIQHFYGGTLSSIHASEGQMVEKGTPLASLDTLEIKSQLKESIIQQKATKGRISRLQYLLKLNSIDELRLPKENEKHQWLMLEQAFISLKTKRAVSQQQIQQLESQIKDENIKLTSLKKQSVLLKEDLDRHQKESGTTLKLLAQEKEALEEEMEIREDLVDQGLNSNIKFLSLQRTYYQLEKDILEKKLEHQEKSSQLQKQILQINQQIDSLPLMVSQHKAKIKETQEQLLEDESKLREETLAELDELLELAQTLNEKVIRLKDRVDQSVIKAPIKGYVHQLKTAGPGAIISPGEEVLQIIPYEAKLLAKIKVDNKDIGHLQTGQQVRLKLTSFDFSRYGSLPGVLEKLAQNSSMDEKGVPYYGAYVKILSFKPSEKRSELPLKTGMSLDADIVTGKKTVMEYLLKPIYASTREALQER
jgi:HlyD family secretion protein/adhesin transport system membrane fusion protein